MAAAADNNWMGKAFANAHGQFTAKAKRAGMTVAAYARKVTGGKSDASTKTKRQGALAALAQRLAASKA